MWYWFSKNPEYYFIELKLIAHYMAELRSRIIMTDKYTKPKLVLVFIGDAPEFTNTILPDFNVVPFEYINLRRIKLFFI